MKRSILITLLLCSILSVFSCEKQFSNIPPETEHGLSVFGFLSESDSFSINDDLSSSYPESLSLSLDNTVYANAYYGNKSTTVGVGNFYIDAENFEITAPSGTEYIGRYNESCDLDSEKYEYGKYADLNTYYSQKFTLKYTGNFEETVGHIIFGLKTDNGSKEHIWYYSISGDKKVSFSFDSPEGYSIKLSKIVSTVQEVNKLYSFDVMWGSYAMVDHADVIEGFNFKSDSLYIYACVSSPSIYAFKTDVPIENISDDSFKNPTSENKVLDHDGGDGKYYMALSPIYADVSASLFEKCLYRFDARDTSSNVCVQIIAVTEQFETPEQIKALFQASSTDSNQFE